MIDLKGKARRAASGAWDKAGEAAIWAMCNRRKALAIGGVLLAGFFLASMLAHPADAEAIPIALPILAGVAALGAGMFAADQAVEGLADILKNTIVGILTWSQSLVLSTAQGSLLETTFTSLIGDGNVHDALYALHHAAVIPLANIVAAAFLVLGMVRIISKAGQTDGGIDTWQFIFLFVMYGAATTAINASWEIMVGLFELSQAVISNIISTGEAVFEFTDPTEGIENTGMLFSMLITSLIVLLVSLVVCGISNAVVIIRAIQIYVFAIFSSVPLAFMVSEGGREMTKAFFKRYAALLLSGAMLAVLFMMFSMSMSAIPWPEVTVTDLGSYAQWSTELTLRYLVLYGAFGYAVFKSGAWSRELLGV